MCDHLPRSGRVQVNIQLRDFVEFRKGDLASKQDAEGEECKSTDPKARRVYLIETVRRHYGGSLTAGAMAMLRVHSIRSLQTPRVQRELFSKGRNFFANALLDCRVS